MRAVPGRFFIKDKVTVVRRTLPEAEPPGPLTEPDAVAEGSIVEFIMRESISNYWHCLRTKRSGARSFDRTVGVRVPASRSGA